MDDLYKDKLKDLTEKAQLNDWEMGAFSDILRRDPPVLSIKQRGIIDRAYKKHFEGGSGDEQIEEAPEEHDNCKIVFVHGDGYYIELKEEGGRTRRVGGPTTKKEGVIALAWLSKALPDIVRIKKKQTVRTPF